MREQGYGRVIFTASTSGIYGNFGQSNYGMAKLGLYGLTRTLALEGRKSNILVNAIAPTGGTRMTEGLIPPQVFERNSSLSWSARWWSTSPARQCQETSGLFEVGGGWIGKTRWERSLGARFRPRRRGSDARGRGRAAGSRSATSRARPIPSRQHRGA
jgi:NAD(P)-dependent dehydrogenase (short-subunit alcohol dehydrogenase family)